MPTAHANNHIIDYTITELHITRDPSVDNYKKARAGLEEVLAAVENKLLWIPHFKVDRPHKLRVTGFTFPDAPGHPGHKDNRAEAAWKYNVERGTNTVDRLSIKAGIFATLVDTQTVGGNANHLSTNVEITFDIKVLEDTK